MTDEWIKKQTFGQTSSYRTKLIFIQDFAKSFKTHPFLHILLTNSQTFFPLFLIVETGHKEDKKKRKRNSRPKKLSTAHDMP